MYLRILASLPPTVFTYASLHRSQLASEQYYVPAMDRELWNQFAQVLTRHGSDPQNIKFAYDVLSSFRVSLFGSIAQNKILVVDNCQLSAFFKD